MTVTGADGRMLARLAFPKWWSMAAEGLVGDQPLRLVPTGTWKRDFRVELGGRQVGLLRTTAWGRLRVELVNGHGASTSLVLAHKSFWRRTYALGLVDGPAFLTLTPVFNWKAFATDLRVTVAGPGIQEEQLVLHVVLAAFGVRLMMSRQAAAA
jgi:hypothetical protein